MFKKKLYLLLAVFAIAFTLTFTVVRQVHPRVEFRDTLVQNTELKLLDPPERIPDSKESLKDFEGLKIQDPAKYTFTSLKRAVTWALAASFIMNDKFEIGGIIYQKGTKYYVSTFVTSGIADRVAIPDKSVDPTLVPVANFHTHPCMPYTHYIAYFSINDVVMGVNTKRLQYMGNLCTGDISEFNYKIDKLDYYTPNGDFLSGGRIIGNIREAVH